VSDTYRGSSQPEFLVIEDVLALHRQQLDLFGGGDGLRDHGLLASAIAQPQATFDGTPLHDGLFAMATAYLFHIVSNHPFVDGNKRTGLLAALTFLQLNGVHIRHHTEALHDLTMGVASGRIDKATVAIELERIARSTP
jgi:death-on-curing protein